MSLIRGWIGWFMEINWDSGAVTAAATVVLAAMTVILAFGTLFLWLATKRLVRGAENTAERELRAYVGVHLLQRPDGANPTFDGIKGPWIALEIRNFGKTPAYKLSHWFQGATGPPDFKGPFKDGSAEVEASPATLQPNAWLQTASLGPESQTGHPEAWAAGKLVAYAWGEVNYIDAFDQPRCTKFRLTYGAADLAGGTIGVRLCPEGNEAD